MTVSRLDHIAIRTARVAETVRFYTDVLGFESGWRPPFDFPGAWLYQGGLPIVHLIGIDPNDAAGLRAYLGEKRADDPVGTGSLDHVAFMASGIDAMRARLRAAGIPFRDRMVPALNLEQVFLDDPNGVTVELNFPTAPAAAEAAR